jgi:hypothetical protein
MPQKVSFLFGSGISIPAKMPSVKEITDKVLSGTGVSSYSNEYYFGPPLYAHKGLPDEHVPRIVAYLRRLCVEIDRFYYRFDYERAANVNYEDLYYVASQIRDSLSGEYDNPILQSCIDKILCDITPLLTWQWFGTIEQWGLPKMASEAANYIHDVVCNFLDKEPANLDYLRCVRDACQDEEISSLDLFTLNHDTVIERYLEKCGIEYTDGFGPPVNGVRYWSPDRLEHSCHNVRLLNLHGSVNWFLFESHGPRGRNVRVGIPVDRRYSDTKDPNGQSQRAVGRPMLLAGTFNKMLRYTSEIYADLYCELRGTMRQTERLIVCGYGFGDKGINGQIGEWVNTSGQKVMVAIHPEREILMRQARLDLLFDWDTLLKSNRLAFVERRIEETSWQDIKAAIQK